MSMHELGTQEVRLGGTLDGEEASITLYPGSEPLGSIPQQSKRVCDVLVERHSGGASKPVGLFHVPESVRVVEWMERFWGHYQRNMTFRAYADRIYRLANGPEGPDCTGLHQIAGLALPVASAVAHAAAELVRRGITITTLKAGSSHISPRLRVEGELPGELCDAASAAGFIVTEDRSGIECPVSELYPDVRLAACGVFSTVLTAWAHGKLTQPYTSYQRWRPQRWPAPIIPLPCDGTVDRARLSLGWRVMEITRRSAWRQLDPLELSRLKSGRDRYSGMDEERMLKEMLCPDDAIMETLEDWDRGYRLRAMRWMCRGLPAHLAMEKVWQEIQYADQQREKAREEQSLAPQE